MKYEITVLNKAGEVTQNSRHEEPKLGLVIAAWLSAAKIPEVVLTDKATGNSVTIKLAAVQLTQASVTSMRVKR